MIGGGKEGKLIDGNNRQVALLTHGVLTQKMGRGKGKVERRFEVGVDGVDGWDIIHNDDGPL